MPQILKEQLRSRILDAARKEFLLRGFSAASMRDIAANAGMTAGNLYRYFPGKEEILRAITEKPLMEIDVMVAALSQERVSLLSDRPVLEAGTEEIGVIMDNLAEAIIPIYRRYPEEFLILMMHSQLNEELTGWFSRLIDALIQKRLQGSYSEESRVLSRGFAVAMFSGFREIFAQSGNDDSQLSRIIHNYLRAFVSALSAGLSEGREQI